MLSVSGHLKIDSFQSLTQRLPPQWRKDEVPGKTVVSPRKLGPYQGHITSPLEQKDLLRSGQSRCMYRSLSGSTVA